ncbi:hypothetical protein C8Q80DRAFT_742320 [Daedaleopsis nitida]|nr:hypothetical protein C8Q80DRAFT_742320 [Daedaleopsis nitida]
MKLTPPRLPPTTYRNFWTAYPDDSRRNPTDELAAKLTKDDGAELVLGIRPNGASYMLLPQHESFRYRLDRPRNPAKVADEFESLSPIQFATKHDLAEKLKSYDSTRSKKKKNSEEPVKDLSRANKRYTIQLGPEKLTEEGIARSSFEHQRVFYRLCQESIRGRQLDHYALQLPPWFHDVRIFSFTFNLWASDLRGHEKMTNPRVLDVGWTEFDRPTDSSDLRAVSTTHLTIEENKYLGNPGKKRLVLCESYREVDGALTPSQTLPDITQEMLRDSVAELLQGLFAPERNNELVPPKLLLVYDRELTFSVLRSFGIEVTSTSHWEVGIKQLLYSEEWKSTNDHRSRRTPWDEPPEEKDKLRRRRSRSPRHDRKSPADERYGRTRQRSLPPRRDALPIYVVDVKEMCAALTLARNRNATVLSDAIALSVQDTALVRGEDDQVIYQAIDLNHWCAGRESRLLGFMWEDMANGGAIDEQRVLREGYANEEPMEPIAGPSAVMPPLSDDEEADPNDYIPPMAQSAPPKPNGKSSGLFDSEDEEEDVW